VPRVTRRASEGLPLDARSGPRRYNGKAGGGEPWCGVGAGGGALVEDKTEA